MISTIRSTFFSVLVVTVVVVSNCHVVLLQVMLGGAGSPGGDDLLTVTVVRDEHGYGMKVSGKLPPLLIS